MRNNTSENHLYKRKQKLQATVQGDLSQFIRNYIKADLTPNTSDHQSERINKGLTEKIIIYPTDPGIYVAIPEKNEDNTDNEEKKYLVTPNSSCTCYDFLYNCDYKTGECCKHIWKLRSMISIGALPPKDALPNLWTLAGIQEDIDAVNNSSSDYPELSQGLVEMQANVSRTEWYNIEYRNVYRKWYRILDEANIEK